MPRISGFRGTWAPNKRPYVTITPDVYVALQGETSIIACGECKQPVNFNDYVTGISTEASVDSPPGSATVTLSIPDNDVNTFYVNGQFIIIPMMEIEIYAKGYYLIGGFPQYYRIFWGVVSSVTKDWSGGSTTVQIQCKDILRWWEVTNTTINPAFLESFGSSAGGYQMWQNQFAGLNPYTVIIQLAREAMGDFSLNTGSFTSFLPEKGPESGVIGSYARDIMTYWQYKFGNIWNSLVLYGSSGKSYQFTGGGGTVSPVQLSKEIFLSEQKLANQNQETQLFTLQPSEIAVFKKELTKAGNVEFFQNEIQTKLSVALQARDQIAYEFFCDPCGDIVFKPPFYNLNVIPNKPVSWINDFEIIDDSITDTEQEVYTHITSSGNAFGGVMDWGLNDEITTPRTGVFDFHLLRRYGFRRLDYSTEWAGDPRKLFFHLMDYLDRTNAKRQNGTITIPMRPELRLGFPVWVPYYDSFFYIQGISHQFSVGGQATTTLTFIARRQKFIAPNNIGIIKKSGTKSVTVKNFNTSSPNKTVQGTETTYSISFPDQAGASSSLAQTSGNQTSNGQPVAIRNPKSGQLLGFPNVVMVFRSQLNGENLQKIIQSFGSSQSAPNQNQRNKVQGQNQTTGTQFSYDIALDILKHLQDDQRGQLLQRLRAHRYEAGMTNAGAYDYAWDESNSFQDIAVVPATSISWGTGTVDPNNPQAILQFLQDASAVIYGGTSKQDYKRLLQQNQKQIDEQIAKAQQAVKDAQAQVVAANKALVAAQKAKNQAAAGNSTTNTGNTTNPTGTFAAASANNTQFTAQADAVTAARQVVEAATQTLEDAKKRLADIQAGYGNVRVLPSLNIIVRPVSDEFGFEVVGHYRYGRGAFIDQGQVKISAGPNSDTPGQTVNQLNIQFAATAGILSDATPVQPDKATSVSFASQFEEMHPDDWITGASFLGTGSPTGQVSQIQFTSQATYTTNMQQNAGRGVWIEADQIRKSITLGELSPQVSIQGLDNAVPNCACGLDRAEWLTILPQELIQQVLHGGNATAPVGQSVQSDPNSLVDAQGNIQGLGGTFAPPESGFKITDKRGAIVGTVSPSDFFSQLSFYLQQQFAQQYQQGNAQRELQDTGQSLGVINNLFNADTQGNVLGDPTQFPMFSQAALGDPNALQQLQNQVNFNFNQTGNAVAAFKNAWNNGATSINQSLAQAVPGGPQFSITTNPPSGVVTQQTPQAPVPAPVSDVTITQPAPQVQPLIVQPTPNIRGAILNPSKNQQLEQQQNSQVPAHTGLPVTKF